MPDVEKIGRGPEQVGQQCRIDGGAGGGGEGRLGAAPLAARPSEKIQQSHGEAASCQRNSVSPRNRPALVSLPFSDTGCDAAPRNRVRGKQGLPGNAGRPSVAGSWGPCVPLL